MTSSSVYVLDANVFMEAARRYYAFDLAPRFWEALIHHEARGQIQSIDRIKGELERGKDELAAWAKDKFSHAFASTNEPAVARSFGLIMAWVNAHPQFFASAKAEFAQCPDGWLVAYAKAKGKNYIVVTQEVLEPGVRRKVKIPNVCQAFDVLFVDTFEMMRRLGVRI